MVWDYVWEWEESWTEHHSKTRGLVLDPGVICPKPHISWASGLDLRLRSDCVKDLACNHEALLFHDQL